MLSFPYLYGSGGGTPSEYTYTMSNNGKFQYPADVKIPNNVTSFSGNSGLGFSYHTEIESVEWEDGTAMSNISWSAFNACTNLQSVNLPASVTKVEGSAFDGCSKLETINFDEEIHRGWGNRCFSNCSALNNASVEKICNSASSIDSACFSGCSSITSITIPCFTSSSTSCCESCTGLQTATVIFKGTNAVVGNSFFNNCTSLTSVTLPASTKILNNYVFQNCSSLQTILLPSTLTSIGASTFKNSGLTTITIPHGVTTLGYALFLGCTALAYAYLPNTVTSGASGATSNQLFYNCPSLTNIELEEGWNCNLVISSPTLTGTSLKAMFESLYDLTDGTAKTLTLGTANFATASSTTYIPEGETEAVPIATIATNKNWTLVA